MRGYAQYDAYYEIICISDLLPISAGFIIHSEKGDYITITHESSPLSTLVHELKHSTQSYSRIWINRFFGIPFNSKFNLIEQPARNIEEKVYTKEKGH